MSEPAVAILTPIADVESQPMPVRASLRAWYALAIVVVATLFGFVDRQILILVTDPLKHDMGLNDSEIGVLLGIGPGLFGAAGAILMGWLADRTARQVILAFCVVFWSIATAAFGIAHSYVELLICTVALGIGEAAMGPVFYSMVPDLFPGKTRTLANLVFVGSLLVGAGLGMALSQAVIDWVRTHNAELPAFLSALAPWRTTFVLVALPGFIAGPAILLVGKVKRLSETIGPASEKASLVGYLRANRIAFPAFCLSTGFYGIVLFAILNWMPTHLIRDLHAPRAAGYGIGAAIAGGTIAGILIAGVLMRVLRKRFGVLTPLRLYQAAMVCAAVPLLLQLFATRPWQVIALLAIQLTASFMGTALSPTLLQDLGPAEVRGRVIGIGTFAYSFMSALAPVFVGGLSDVFGATPNGLLWAIEIVGLPSFALAAGIVILADKPLQRTIRAYAPPA